MRGGAAVMALQIHGRCPTLGTHSTNIHTAKVAAIDSTSRSAEITLVPPPHSRRGSEHLCERLDPSGSAFDVSLTLFSCLAFSGEQDHSILGYKRARSAVAEIKR